MRACLLKGSTWVRVEVAFDTGRAEIIEDEEPAPPYLVPGLVDIHCHGVLGLDVMDGRATEIALELRRFGIEWYCPTTVTAKWSRIETVAGVELPRGAAGFHIEGPFINPKKAGAQPVEEIKLPDISRLLPIIDKVRIVTLAPELPGAYDLIGELAARGVIVSAGHTDASYGDLSEARAAGLRHMTHFFNAMRGFAHRGPGSVGFGLLNDVRCELVYDRRHVSREAAQLLFRCKDPRDIIGVSDGTMLSGMPEGTIAEMWGHRVELKDGCARLPDGTLAGSSSTLADVFTNIWQDIGSAEAVLACSVNPREALRLPEPELWLIVSEDGQILDVVEGRLVGL